MMCRLSLCVFLAAGASACGTIKTVESTPDASADDTDAAPASGEATVQVLEQFDDSRFGEPMVDQPVLFFGPDGEVIEDTTTDDEGMAAATVPADSIVVVLVVFPGSGERVGMTIYDVQPGDEIVFRSPRDDASSAGANLGTMNIEVPALDEGGGDIDYQAFNGCDSSTVVDAPPITGLTFHERCVKGGEVDVLVRAIETATGTIVDSTYKHATFTDTGLVSIASWKGVEDLGIDVTGVPDEVKTARYDLSARKGGLDFGGVSNPTIMPDSDAFDLGMAKNPDFGDGLLLVAEYEPTQSSLMPGTQLSLYTLETDASDVAIDLGQTLLPWYTLPIYDEGNRHITWTGTGSERAPDALYVVVSGKRKSDGERVTWVAVVPAGRTEATLPELPDEHDDHAPVGYAEVSSLVVFALETNEFDGYDIRRVGIKPFLGTIQGGPPAGEIGSMTQISLGGEL